MTYIYRVPEFLKFPPKMIPKQVMGQIKFLKKFKFRHMLFLKLVSTVEHTDRNIFSSMIFFSGGLFQSYAICTFLVLFSTCLGSVYQQMT